MILGEAFYKNDVRLICEELEYISGEVSLMYLENLKG